MWTIIEGRYKDEGQWKYHFKYLYEIYAKAGILRLTSDIQKKLKSDSVASIIDYIVKELSRYDQRDDSALKINDSISLAMKEINDRREGMINPYIRTGNERFDSLLKIDFNEIILFAAAKKIGTTKFALHMMMEILEIDPSIAVRIYSFELSEKEVMYEFISREIELKSSEIQSKGYVLTNDDMKRPRQRTEAFRVYGFIARPASRPPRISANT